MKLFKFLPFILALFLSASVGNVLAVNYSKSSLQVDSLTINTAVTTVTAAKTLVAGDNGTVYSLDAAAGAAITLPSHLAGLQFRFIVGSTFITTNWTIVAATADLDTIEGAVIVNGAHVSVVAADQMNFVNSAENVGDYITLTSDGTTWFVEGSGLTAGSITGTG